jgi:hypothetical protein
MAAPALPVVALQEWAGLQHAAPAIQQGLCNALRQEVGVDFSPWLHLHCMLLPCRNGLACSMQHLPSSKACAMQCVGSQERQQLR